MAHPSVHFEGGGHVQGTIPLYSDTDRRDPVLGLPDRGVDSLVADLQDVSRGEVAGYNVKRTGVMQQVFPRVSRADYANLSRTRLPEAEGYLEALLAEMPGMSAEARRLVLSSKKAVQSVGPDGEAVVELVAALPPAKDEVELAWQELDVQPEYIPADGMVAVPLAKREKKRKYTLTQVIGDLSVVTKYRITARQLETAKRLAATDAAGASAALQDVMNAVQTRVAVTVEPGVYVQNKAQARNAVAVITYAYQPTSVSVESELIGSEIFMYGPQGRDDWHVSGPLKNAVEVARVYWMICAEGCVNPYLLMELEFVMLGINVFDGRSCQAPRLEFHAGDGEEFLLSGGLSVRATALMTSEQRIVIESFTDRLLPVLGESGVQVASAVRVTEQHVLINSHVLDAEPRCTVQGAKVEPQVQLSRDLWSARCEGVAQPWVLREPVSGETAIICYAVGSTVACSSPVRVVTIDSQCIVTTMASDVVAGTSGGALVAMSDFALLGVHSSSTMTNLLAHRFGATQFSQLVDSLSETGFSRQSDVGSFAASVYDRFKRKGLGHVFTTAIRSLVPVYVHGAHAGMAVRNGPYLYTTCDPDFPLRFGDNRTAYVMETAEVEKMFRVEVPGVEPSPVFRRKPVHYEKVFVLGYDVDAYLSQESAVLHVGPNARSFVIRDIPGLDKPLLGGLVMGYDGAVLGLCGALSATTQAGLGYVCWPLPQIEAKQAADSRTLLAVKFPFLNMPAWSKVLLEEVFTHSSVGRYADGRQFNAGCKPLANIGDNAAKAELYQSLRVAGLPHSTWSARMQALQSNLAYAKVAWQHGFAECLITGEGATFGPESKAYADLTEALLGAAYLVERREVFVQLCASMGILEGAGANVTSGMVRSVSDGGGIASVLAVSEMTVSGSSE